MIKIAIILGSTRPGRNGEVGATFRTVAASRASLVFAAKRRGRLITAAAQLGGNQALAEACEDHFSAATCFAHCQNFSAAGLSRLFGAAIPMESVFGSGVSRKSFTRCPKA